jgi:hypothetical protein
MSLTHQKNADLAENSYKNRQAQQLAQFQAQQQSISAQTKSGPGLAFG